MDKLLLCLFWSLGAPLCPDGKFIQEETEGQHIYLGLCSSLEPRSARLGVHRKHKWIFIKIICAKDSGMNATFETSFSEDQDANNRKREPIWKTEKGKPTPRTATETVLQI